MNFGASIKRSLVYFKYIDKDPSQYFSTKEIKEYTENRIETELKRAYRQGSIDKEKEIRKTLKMFTDTIKLNK